jgi:CRISPR/Cas system CMR subunit Cmr4 (Cas7 group RAMP superfamily)
MFDHLTVLRITIQTTSPVSIGTGSSDMLQQMTLVRDANGLPVIPGSTLAGVFRHLHEEDFGSETTRSLFGKERPGSPPVAANGGIFEASRLIFSSAHVHNQSDQPVDGLELNPDSAWEKQPVLRLLRKTVLTKRDHVRIDSKGTAEDTGKFDRSAVPTGTRFTFDIQLQGNQPDEPGIGEIVACLSHPALRFGGAVRSGYGSVSVVRVAKRVFHLRDKEARSELAAWARRLDKAVPGALPIDLSKSGKARKSGYIELSIKLEPRDLWRIGGAGNTPLAGHSDLGGNAIESIQAVTYQEKNIAWTDNRPELEAAHVVVLPGSSFKGAIRHRTAYHLLCLKLRDDKDAFTRDKNAPLDQCEIVELFGAVKDTDADSGNAGRLSFSDIVLPADSLRPVVMHHNGIDRFTGGVRARTGVLFTEELVFGGEFTLNLLLKKPEGISKRAGKALRLALDDLFEGRLSIGAGSAKGHGYLKGKKADQPPDTEKWLAEAQS